MLLIYFLVVTHEVCHCVLYEYVVCIYYDVTYAFQSESTLYICLSFKELLAWNRCDIWSLIDSNRIQTINHLVFERTLSHLAKLTWLGNHFKLDGCVFQSRWCYLKYVVVYKKRLCQYLSKVYSLINCPILFVLFSLITSNYKYWHSTDSGFK